MQEISVYSMHQESILLLLTPMITLKVKCLRECIIYRKMVEKKLLKAIFFGNSQIKT